MSSNLEKCAIIELHHGQFKIIEPGDYVLCSITKKKIPLENLKYWNVELQEAYFSPLEVNESYKKFKKKYMVSSKLYSQVSKNFSFILSQSI